MALMLAAFRCPGPDPQGDPDPFAATGGSGGGGGPAMACDVGADEDRDQDGWTVADGDCDDCDPTIHPDAAEVPTRGSDTPADENCDGNIDEPVSCEPSMNGPQITAEDAAHAIELCDRGDRAWGLVSARFTRADGDTLPPGGNLYQQKAVSETFGNQLTPRAGDKMLVLSTGHALPGAQATCASSSSCGNVETVDDPPDSIATLAGCPVPTNIYDDIALEVKLRPPPNAGGFAFHTAYLTHEYPQSICSPFVDQFLALIEPKPGGWASANMVFDRHNMPPSVSFESFPHCDPSKTELWANLCPLMDGCPTLPDPFCDQGPALLSGTGFGDGGASTGWMETTVPLAEEGEIQIRFLIYDTANIERDSTVLIDGFTWLARSDLGNFPETKLK